MLSPTRTPVRAPRSPGLAGPGCAPTIARPVRGAGVTIEFSEQVRGPGGAPLSEDDFQIDGSSLGISSFAYDDVSHVATFAPPTLDDRAWHTIRVSGAIQDLAGNKLAGTTSGAEPGADHCWIDLAVLRADFQQDYDVDVFDRTQFLAAWTDQNGQTGVGLSADYQCDGDVDVPDRTQFLEGWAGNNGIAIGSPPSH